MKRPSDADRRLAEIMAGPNADTARKKTILSAVSGQTPQFVLAAIKSAEDEEQKKLAKRSRAAESAWKGGH